MVLLGLLAIGLLPSKTARAQCEHSRRIFYQEDVQPRNHPVDMLQMTLELEEFQPRKGKVSGQVTHRFRVLQESTDSLYLDRIGIDIESATLGGEPINFEAPEEAEGLVLRFGKTLQVGETYEVSIAFHSQPRKGLYFTGWNAPPNTARRQIWTQGQGIDHRHWFPCYDDANDKLITETLIRFNENYEVLSNGELLEKRNNGDGTLTWHYRISKPHSVYLLMLAIGKYKIRELKSESGVPVNLYYYPDHEDRFEYIYKYSAEAIDFMEEHTRTPYPWSSYSQVPVQDFIYGAMENTTATIFGDFFCVDARGFLDRNYINVNVHELTHQWFGDMITHRSSKDIWLHESFATFYPKLFEREVYGPEHYAWKRRSEQNAALRAAEQNNYPIRSTLAGVSRWYPKGSAVLDMMLHVWGEQQYQRVIEYYLARHAYENVATVDLEHAFLDTLGVNPSWFFDQWIRAGGEPHYKVQWEDLRAQGSRYTQVEVSQVHPRTDLIGFFRMPIDIAVYYKDGTADRKRVWVEHEHHSFRVENPVNKPVAFVVFDEGSWVIKQLTFQKPLNELLAQAQLAQEMIDRYDAVKALEEHPFEDKIEVFETLMEEERFHAIPAEIVRQLVNEPHERARKIIRQALRDPRKEVREAAITNVERIPVDLRTDFEALLQDSSYNVVTKTLRKLYDSFPGRAESYLKVVADDYGVGNQVRVAWCEISTAEGDEKAFAELVTRCSNAHEFYTRRYAMQALMRVNRLNQEAVYALVEGYLSQNRRLGAVAKQALQHFYAQHAFRDQLQEVYQEGAWNERQLGDLEEIFGYRP